MAEKTTPSSGLDRHSRSQPCGKTSHGDIFLTRKVSNLDTPEIVTQQIPLAQIDTNDRNFYAVEDVTDLKESIELIGLKQPLVVLEVDGTHYRLIAGHRRYKALTELGRESAPCVVQRDLTETQEQLALILTNSTTRELTYLEKAEQAVRLKRLFIKRREEGAELPGRIRDMVAEAMQESASNIARMEAIDKHLVGEWKQSLKKGHISASTAYELSKLDKAAQKKLQEALFAHSAPTAKVIKAAGEIVQDYPFAPLVCPKSYNNPCTRYKERADMVTAGTCPGCCADCDHTEGCSALCGVCKKQLTDAQMQAEQREAERKADEAYQHSAYRQAQLSILDWAQDPNLDEDNELPAGVSQTVRSLRGITNLTRRTWMPGLSDLFALADALGITLAELLGLAPELPPCTSEWHKYPVDKPEDGETVLCRYGKNGCFRLLTYQAGTFGEMVAGEFVSLPFDVSDWTRAYPGA